MSSSKPKEQADSFGYRLISPDGNVKLLNPADLKTYRADETDPVVSAYFEKQIDMLARNGLHPSAVMPGKVGSLIVGGYAWEAEKVLDAAFGVPELDRTSRRQVRETSGLKEVILNSFDFAASGQFVALPLIQNFQAAAAQPANDRHAPVYEETRRLAA